MTQDAPHSHCRLLHCRRQTGESVASSPLPLSPCLLLSFFFSFCPFVSLRPYCDKVLFMRLECRTEEKNRRGCLQLMSPTGRGGVTGRAEKKDWKREEKKLTSTETRISQSSKSASCLSPMGMRREFANEDGEKPLLLRLTSNYYTPLVCMPRLSIMAKLSLAASPIGCWPIFFGSPEKRMYTYCTTCLVWLAPSRTRLILWSIRHYHMHSLVGATCRNIAIAPINSYAIKGDFTQ